MENNSKTEKKDLSMKVNDWLAKNKTLLISALCVIILAGAAWGVIALVSSNKMSKQQAIFDALEIQYEELFTNYDLSDDEKAAEKADILANALELANNNTKNGVGAHAFILAADIEFDKQDYVSAIADYEKAANAKPKAYTTPIAFYNIAIAYEMQGNNASAIEYFAKAAECNGFTLSSKALFNCGRLSEASGNFADAAKYYTKITEGYTDEWASLANTRLITLEVERKIY